MPARSRPRSARPSARTSLAEIARPSPVPPYRRVVEPSACANGSKIVSLLLGGDADAGVGDGEAERRRRRRRAASSATVHDDLAALGELDGVADQVDQDLPQPAGVADQRVGHVRRDPAGQLQALVVRPQRQGLQRLVRSRRAGRTAPGRGSSLPASILEKSRMSLMTVSSASAERLDQAEVLALLAASSSVSSASSVMPMMPFIGVRISWLMLARNSLLARLAASAASLARCSSSWRALDLGDVRPQAHDAAVARGKVANSYPAIGESLFRDARPSR